MPVNIDDNYRLKVHGFVQRNMARRKPIKDAFNMLSRWRNMDRLLTMEDNREFAMERVAAEEKASQPKVPVVVKGDENVTNISFIPA